MGKKRKKCGGDADLQIKELAEAFKKTEQKIRVNEQIIEEISTENADYARRLCQETDVLEHKKQDLKVEMINKIRAMSDERYVRVLYERYVNCKSYSEIAIEMAYSVDHVKRLHREALNMAYGGKKCEESSDHGI